jgi:hypothetical protein
MKARPFEQSGRKPFAGAKSEGAELGMSRSGPDLRWQSLVLQTISSTGSRDQAQATKILSITSFRTSDLRHHQGRA